MVIKTLYNQTNNDNIYITKPVNIKKPIYTIIWPNYSVNSKIAIYPPTQHTFNKIHKTRTIYRPPMWLHLLALVDVLIFFKIAHELIKTHVLVSTISAPSSGSGFLLDSAIMFIWSSYCCKHIYTQFLQICGCLKAINYQVLPYHDYQNLDEVMFWSLYHRSYSTWASSTIKTISSILFPGAIIRLWAFMIITDSTWDYHISVILDLCSIV